MSKPKYPTYIHTFEGEGAALFQGHNLDRAMVDEEVDRILGEAPIGFELQIFERHYIYKGNIKHCSRHGDSWGCDEDGNDYHGHWFEIKPTDDSRCHFTEAFYKRTHDVDPG